MKKHLALLWLVAIVAVCSYVFLPSAASCASTDARLIAKSGDASLYDSNGVKLLTLKGTFYEMGQQYGKLMGKDIARMYDTAIGNAFVKTGFFSETELNNFADQNYATMPMRQKQLIRGMVAGSGLSQQKVVLASDIVMVQILARKKAEGNSGACTTGATWGKYTADGSLYTVRNFDFPNLFRTLLKDNAVVVIFNPNDGSNAVGGVGLVGSIYFVDMINNKGLYIETNNAADSAGLVLYSNRTQAGLQLINMLFDADNEKEFYNYASSTRFSYSIIMLVADKQSASFYELTGWDMRKRVANNDTVISAANQFEDPVWGILNLPSPAAWYSSYRSAAMMKALQSAPVGGINLEYIKKVLDLPLYNSDGTLGTGFSVLAKNPKDDEVTVWQVITKPDKLQIWLRFPTITDWQLIDFKQYFRSK
jgi:hypothetical protein